MAFKAPARIRYVASPFHSPRPGGPGDISVIVMHETGSSGSPDAIAQWFRNPNARVSAHDIIGKTGRIVQSVRPSQQAWHAGPSSFKGRHHVNQFSIGIEMVNKSNGKDGVADKYLNDWSDVYSRAAVNLRMECKRIGIDPASL